MGTPEPRGPQALWSWDAWIDDRSFGGVTDVPHRAGTELHAAMVKLPADGQGYVRRAYPPLSGGPSGGLYKYGEPELTAYRNEWGALVMAPTAWAER